MMNDLAELQVTTWGDAIKRHENGGGQFTIWLAGWQDGCDAPKRRDMTLPHCSSAWQRITFHSFPKEFFPHSARGMKLHRDEGKFNSMRRATMEGGR
jgi:hypothetical protein